MHIDRNHTRAEDTFDKFRELAAPIVTVAALLVSGCGRVADSGRKIGNFTPDEVMKEGPALLHQEVQVDGTPCFEADTSPRMPSEPQLVMYLEYWYSLPCISAPDGKLWIRTAAEFEPRTISISGTIESGKHGVYINTTGSIHLEE